MGTLYDPTEFERGGERYVSAVSYAPPSDFQRAFCSVVYGSSAASRAFAARGWTFSSVPLAPDGDFAIGRVPGAELTFEAERLPEILQFLQASSCLGLAVRAQERTYQLLAGFRHAWQRQQFLCRVFGKPFEARPRPRPEQFVFGRNEEPEHRTVLVRFRQARICGMRETIAEPVTPGDAAGVAAVVIPAGISVFFAYNALIKRLSERGIVYSLKSGFWVGCGWEELLALALEDPEPQQRYQEALASWLAEGYE